MSRHLDFWPDKFPKMATVYQDGATAGQATIVHRTITESERIISMVSCMQHGRGYVRTGDTYAELHVGGTLWMSDTMDERSDHGAVAWTAHGRVLIGGLGLGMVALRCALKDEVSAVTVIERNADVVALAEPHLRRALGDRADRLRIVHGDLMTWTPPKGEMWDTLWFDIWPSLCTDDLAEHATLNRRFAKRTAPGGYRDCWGSHILKRRREQERERDRWRRVWR